MPAAQAWRLETRQEKLLLNQSIKSQIISLELWLSLETLKSEQLFFQTYHDLISATLGELGSFLEKSSNAN